MQGRPDLSSSEHRGPPFTSVRWNWATFGEDGVGITRQPSNAACGSVSKESARDRNLSACNRVCLLVELHLFQPPLRLKEPVSVHKRQHI